MPTKLKRLKVDEISFCKRGANPRARVLVRKSVDEPSAGQRFMDALKRAFRVASPAPARAEIDKAIDEMEQALKSAPPAAPKTPAENKMTLDEAIQRIRALEGQEEGEEEDDEDGDAPPRPRVTSTKKEYTMPTPVQAEEIERLRKAAGDAEALRKQMEEQAAALKKVQEENEALAKRIAENEEREAVAKATADAKTLLGTLPGDAVKLGSLLRKATSEERAAFEQVAKAAREAQAAAKLFEPVGKSGPMLKAEEEFEARVAKAMQENPKLTRPQAITKVLDADPVLYERVTSVGAVN